MDFSLRSLPGCNLPLFRERPASLLLSVNGLAPDAKVLFFLRCGCVHFEAVASLRQKGVDRRSKGAAKEGKVTARRECECGLPYCDLDVHVT